jgi:hypothetical protein
MAPKAKLVNGGVKCMNVWDLIKATVVCGLLAFLCFSFPVLGQALIIGVLSLLWLGYARKTILTLWRK